MNEKRFENRLDKSNVKFNVLNPVWDNKKEDALNVFEMITLLNELNEERSSMARGFDKYQAHVGYVIGQYSRMFDRNSKEFSLVESIAEDLGFDTESMESKNN